MEFSLRYAEVRILVIVLLAMCVIVTGAWWWGLHGMSGGWMRPAPMVLGAVVCVVLAFVGLRRDWRAHQNEMMAQIQNSIGRESEHPPVMRDNLVQPIVTAVYESLGSMRQRVEQLQIQRKDLEIQLRLADAERRQSQTLINGISDAVLVSNEFDELISANPVAESLFHFDLKQKVRSPVSEVLSGTQLVEAISELRQNHSHSNRRNFEMTLGIEGDTKLFNVMLSSVLDGTGQFSSVVTVLHDKTREQEVSRMKSEFVSYVSHELRTPLSSIKAYAELLVDGEAADEKAREEFYHIIQSEADRLSRLIDNILNVSRLEAGITRINKRPVSLTTIGQEVLEVARPTAKDKNITIVEQIPPSFFQIEADRDMIYQAILNLVSNAIKYTPSGGTVKVTVYGDEAQGIAGVEVTDTGVGIPAEAMKHLFQKFFRVEQNKKMAKGTGLGLNLTRQIIESVHHGRMLVRSEVGKGSTFGFTLPIMQ